MSGDPVSMTYPGGMILTYQRDADGQIAGILADGQAVVSGVGYLPFGPVKNKTLGGLTVSETFDERYHLSRIQAGTVADYQYVRDAAGNITSRIGSEIPLITTADAGNTGYSYTANRLVSTAGRSCVYDSDGNILSDGIRTFAYNQDNRLVRVSISGAVVGEYAYDAYGRRVKKVASGVTTLYHYAGGNLIAETDENGNPQRDYIYLNGEPAALRIYGAQFGTMYYFVNDHLGTPQKIVDSSAQVVWAAAYLPFGKAQVKSETITNNLRFPGQYFDAESGLHYNWNRYYDSDTGRYITADPIGLSGGINLYSYVLNNPVNGIDPDGLVIVETAVVAYWTVNAVTVAVIASVAYLNSDEGKKRLAQIASDINALMNSGKTNLPDPGILGNAVITGNSCPSDPDNKKDKKKKQHNKHGGGKEDVDRVAKEVGVDRHEFGKYVDKMKGFESRGGADNYSYSELRELAKQFKAFKGR